MSAIDDPQRVTVSSVLMKRNLPSLAEMPGILGPLRVPKYILQGLITLNSDGQEQRLDELRDAKVSIERIKAASAQNGVELVLTMPDELDRELSDAPVPAIQPASSASPAPESRQCGIPWELAFVDKDGLVFPCCYASALRADTLGNLREEGFVDIWQGDRYQHFRQRLVEGDLPDCCRGCDAAPPGEHPLRRYAAELVLEESDLEGEHEVRAVFRNRGTVTWDQSSRVRIGTASPRDGASAYHHPTWIAPHRVTTFLEERVPPGESGTFSFRIAPQLRHASENFQLMVEDVAWLPGTTFQVQPRRSLATRLVLATQPVARAYHRARRFSVREAIRTRTLSR
jgi:radical SAM protein with 4Fe4S-binding SPASM domain